MTDLGNLGGVLTNVSPEAINNQGQIVGFADAPSGSPQHAFLYCAGMMTDLNDLIDPTSGWTLEYAAGINDNGQIVGYGISPSSQIHGFLLTPRPVLQNLQVTGGYAQFSLIGMTGFTYQVDYTLSLSSTNWVTLTNFVLPTSPCLFQDASEALSEQRYYRAVQFP